VGSMWVDVGLARHRRGDSDLQRLLGSALKLNKFSYGASAPAASPPQTAVAKCIITLVPGRSPRGSLGIPEGHSNEQQASKQTNKQGFVA